MILVQIVDANSTDPSWNLNELNGKPVRDFSRHVNFVQSFTTTPSLVVGLNRLEIDGPGARLAAFARNITTHGFDMVFETWADTKVFSAQAMWIAVGDPA